MLDQHYVNQMTFTLSRFTCILLSVYIVSMWTSLIEHGIPTIKQQYDVIALVAITYRK